MPTHNYQYKNLVFEGGGVKGVAYGGVFEVLEQSKSRRRLNRYRELPPKPAPRTLIVFNGCLSHFLDFTYDSLRSLNHSVLIR